MEESTTFTMRVPTALKKAFEQAAKATDRPAAQLLRDHMRWYVDWYMKNRAQTDMLETPRKKK